MLAIIAPMVNTLGHVRVKPSVYLRPMAQPTSNSPATNNAIQAMATSFRNRNISYRCVCDSMHSVATPMVDNPS
jgi:hypothetical protein